MKCICLFKTLAYSSIPSSKIDKIVSLSRVEGRGGSGAFRKDLHTSFPMASSTIPVVVGYPIMTNAIALISPTSIRIGPDKYQYDYMVILFCSLLGGLFTGAAVAAILAPRRCIFISKSRLAFVLQRQRSPRRGVEDD